MTTESADQPTAPPESEWHILNPFRRFNFASYLKEEFVQSKRKRLERSGASNQGPFNDRVSTFINVPRSFESFVGYGLLQCLDHLLVIYTLLPLRCAMIILRLLLQFISKGIYCIFGVIPRPFARLRSGLLYSHEIRDCVRFSLLLFCTIMLVTVDSSVAYHEIRTQSVIKIYIFFNLLEVADRLLSAVCQDALDDLLYTASRFRRFPAAANSRKKDDDWTATSEANEANVAHGADTVAVLRDFLPQYAFALVCLSIHCLLLLCQVTTLNVAFNSQNKSLVTVFISNNFVELKSNVFRKMGKTNLFQIACADVRERFHYAVWLFIVVCRNMTDTGWNFDELWPMMFDVLCIFLAEVAVDWVKHSFITKFNVIPSDVYNEYTVSLAYDLLLCRQGKTPWFMGSTSSSSRASLLHHATQNTADYFDLLSRRMGLTPIPLCCLINVMLIQTIRSPGFLWLALPVMLCVLFTVKIVANMMLLSWAYARVKAYIKAVRSTVATVHPDTISNQPTEPTDKQPDPDRLGETASCIVSASDQLTAIRFAGYDQPTREEDNVLPTVLRHRRLRIDSGHSPSRPFTPSPVRVERLNAERLTFGSDQVRQSAAHSPNSVIASGDSVCADSSLRSRSPTLEHANRIAFVVTEPSTPDPCQKSIMMTRGSHFMQTPADSLPIKHVRSRMNSGNSNWESTNSLLDWGKPTHQDRMTSPQLITTPYSCMGTSIEPNESLLSTPLNTMMRSVEPQGGTRESSEAGLDWSALTQQQRCYSIDLGVLSSFSRLSVHPTNSSCSNIANYREPHTCGLQTAPLEDNYAHVGVQTEWFPRVGRRVRTWTESSVTGLTQQQSHYNGPGVDPLPVMWERSSRNSFSRPPGKIQFSVKQPLSDVDRYSMAEGQIS